MTELIVAVPLVTLKLRYIIDDEDMLIELLASRRYLYPAFKVSDVITNSSLATDVAELKALSYILAEFAFTEQMFLRKPVCNTAHRAWGYSIKHFRPG